MAMLACLLAGLLPQQATAQTLMSSLPKPQNLECAWKNAQKTMINCRFDKGDSSEWNSKFKHFIVRATAVPPGGIGPTYDYDYFYGATNGYYEISELKADLQAWDMTLTVESVYDNSGQEVKSDYARVTFHPSSTTVKDLTPTQTTSSSTTTPTNTTSTLTKTGVSIKSDGKVELTFPESSSGGVSISVFRRMADNSSLLIGNPITYTISDSALQTQITYNNNGTVTATIPRRYLTDKSGASPVIFENGDKYFFEANGLHSDDITYQGPASDGSSSCLAVEKTCPLETPKITKANDYYVLEFGEGIPNGDGSKEEAGRYRIRIFGVDDASRALAEGQASKMSSMEGAPDWDNAADDKFTVFLRNADFAKTYTFDATIIQKKTDTISQYADWPDATRTLRFTVSAAAANDLTIQNLDTGATTAPAAVNKVELTENTTDRTITAKWDAVSGADDYEVSIIYAQPANTGEGSGQNFTKKGTTKGTSYSISAYAGTQYNITVRARKSQLYSPSTSSGITTTVKQTSFTADEIAALSLPKATLDNVTEGQTATATFNTVDGSTSNIQVLKAEVKWTAVTIDNPSFSNYRVFWRKQEASPVDWKYAAQVAVPKDVTTYTITAINPNTTYEYMVSAEFLTKTENGDAASSTFKSITDVKTFKTGDVPTATFSTSYSNEYKAALKRQRVGAGSNGDAITFSPTNLAQSMVIHPVLLNADGSKTLGADLFANIKNNLVKQPSDNNIDGIVNADGEWYANISIPASVASKMIGLAFGGSGSHHSSQTGYDEAIYVMKYKGGAKYGACDDGTGSPECALVDNNGNLKPTPTIFIPTATLIASPHVQMETLKLDPIGGTRSSSEGITIEYAHQLVGLPVHLNFNVQAFSTSAAEITNLSLKAAQESQDSNVLDGFTSSGKVNLTFEARNATKCYVRENEGAWTELTCANITGNQTVPYTLKTTSAGDVRLQLKIDSASGSQESNTLTVKLDTTLPTVTLSGFPTSWASKAVSDLSVSCAAGSSSCKQLRLVQTNKLSENQTCGDLQTVAPSELSVAAVCSASNNNCKDLSFESEPGAQKTYICAVAQNNSGKFAFSQKYELKVDTKIPEVLANLKDLIASGAATFTKEASITIHVNPVTLGPSGLATCQVAGDITSPVSCTANGGDYNVNLTGDSGSKKITVSATNNAGKAGVKELNIIRDATAPVFVSGSAIKISNKTTNGAATLQPAPAQDSYLDRVELTVHASHDTNFVLPSSVLASIPSDVRVQGNKLTILANETGELAPTYVTTGLSLQNLPVDANGQAISYTVEEKAFDKAGNGASETKTVQFTLRDVVSTETITITSGSVALSGEVDSSTIPVTGLVFSSGPVFYTTTENSTESAKSAFNNFVFLPAGAHTGVTVKFYDSQNRQIGNAFGPFNVTVKSAGATMTLDGAQVVRVKDATYALKATSIASTDDKVTYKISKNGVQVTTGERLKTNYASAFDLSTIELAENARTEVFVTITDAAGKNTIYQKTLIRDTRAPEVKDFQTSTTNNTPTWTFTAQDELEGTVQELKARAIDLTSGEASTEMVIPVVPGGSYTFNSSQLSLRPGHEYVLDVTAKDALGNSITERSPQPVVLARNNVDMLDMLQKGITVDGSVVNTERLRVTLTNTSDSTFRYQAELPRGKQVIFKDILEKGQHTGTSAKWTKLPVGVYQARLETVGANTTGTQNVNFVVEPYYADNTGDLNGDGRVGMSDEVIYKLAQNNGKYAGSDNALATLRGAIDSKLAQSIMADLREYLRR